MVEKETVFAQNLTVQKLTAWIQNLQLELISLMADCVIQGMFAAPSLPSFVTCEWGIAAVIQYLSGLLSKW